MKQTVEEAAIEAAEDCYEMPYNENLLHMILIKQAFELGAEWQEKQSPWISVEDELPPYNKDVLLLNTRNETVGRQIFNDGYDIKTYCDWYCISYWMLANFPK